MNISKAWAMPNKDTFSIKPIYELISTYVTKTRMLRALGQNTCCIIDPFSNGDKYNWSDVTNDIDPSIDADYHMDALDFLKMFGDETVDIVLFDPPYSPRQVSECYKKLDKTVNMQTTQSSFWSKMKAEIGRIAKPNGIVITCGWNSGGIGKKYGFSTEEILLVAHGGWHNDTIVTVEIKH